MALLVLDLVTLKTVHDLPEAFAIVDQPRGEPVTKGRQDGRLVVIGHLKMGCQATPNAVGLQRNCPLTATVKLGSPFFLSGKVMSQSIEALLGLLCGSPHLLYARNLCGPGPAFVAAGRLQSRRFGARSGNLFLQPANILTCAGGVGVRLLDVTQFRATFT